MGPDVVTVFAHPATAACAAAARAALDDVCPGETPEAHGLGCLLFV